MSMKTAVVSLIRCQQYDMESVREALRQSLVPFGGMESVVRPGQRVLLKVNLLSPKTPDKAVTTHPSLVRAVIEAVQQCGGIPSVGDSSGGMMKGSSSTARALKVSGVEAAAKDAGAIVINFDTDGICRVPNPQNNLAPELAMARAVLEADVVINLPKLKTHSATLYTGAVKNLYGTIPGYQKAEYHRIAPALADFSRILVDIYRLVKPALTVMDGIWAMEGNGPAHGKPVHAGYLLAGRDGVAVDAVASSIIGFEPNRIDTTRIAHELGVGVGDLSCITVSGLSLADAKLPGFKLPTNALLARIPPMLVRGGLGMIRAKPRVQKQKCTGCGFCCENCPAGAMVLTDGYPVIDEKACILCYCCQELCPQGAVIVHHVSPLIRGWMRLRGG